MGCESCHGPGSAHVDSGDKEDIIGDLSAADCKRCHNAERVNNFKFKPLLFGHALNAGREEPMTKLFAAITHHLWAKVMLTLLPIMLIIFGLIIFTNIHAQNRILSQQAEASANQTATSIEGGMFDALAIGNNDEVQSQFQRLNEKVSGLEVHIFDFNGDIAFATQAERTGRNIDTLSHSEESRAAVQALLQQGQKPQQAFSETIDGKPYLSIYRPIQNESRCFHCHGQSRKVLGGIHVRTETEATMQAAISLRNRSILIGIVGALLLSLMIYVLFHKLVNRPIREVLAVAGSMRQGDLTHSIAVKGRDEISHMSARMNLVNKNLREMIGEIASASQSVAESASQQAASLEETSASLEELTAMASRNSEHATQADKLMTDAIGQTQCASQSMDRLASAIRISPNQAPKSPISSIPSMKLPFKPTFWP